jgi:hypothetical protein
MYDLACKMLKAILQSSPGEIDPGEWHLPFVEDTEYLTLEQSKRDIGGQVCWRLVRDGRRGADDDRDGRLTGGSLSFPFNAVSIGNNY